MAFGRKTGGRKKGTPNKRSTNHALRELIDAEGIDPAVALMRIAREAEEREDYALAVDAFGKILPFLHARPKPREFAPDAVVELEKRLAAARVEGTVIAAGDESLAERLQRAIARQQN
ncbi:hypothetical protein [Maritalea mediterranea]|uniref:DUF5681 domain-containing protein n=1 Tax=Maritalea mediterranea TaxID=2909667 RepID=A0ABS9EET1_9HYPH|nr:hypothetical protein [Maritalea mediterranea]MCF4099918.1 hypothetical protein [Maritalea mediterranea]